MLEWRNFLQFRWICKLYWSVQTWTRYLYLWLLSVSIIWSLEWNSETFIFIYFFAMSSKFEQPFAVYEGKDVLCKYCKLFPNFLLLLYNSILISARGRWNPHKVDLYSYQFITNYLTNYYNYHKNRIDLL